MQLSSQLAGWQHLWSSTAKHWWLYHRRSGALRSCKPQFGDHTRWCDWISRPPAFAQATARPSPEDWINSSGILPLRRPVPIALAATYPTDCVLPLTISPGRPYHPATRPPGQPFHPAARPAVPPGRPAAQPAGRTPTGPAARPPGQHLTGSQLAKSSQPGKDSGSKDTLPSMMSVLVNQRTTAVVRLIQAFVALQYRLLYACCTASAVAWCTDVCMLRHEISREASNLSSSCNVQQRSTHGLSVQQRLDSGPSSFVYQILAYSYSTSVHVYQATQEPSSCPRNRPPNPQPANPHNHWRCTTPDTNRCGTRHGKPGSAGLRMPVTQR